jgi:hypothetical protein
VEELHGEHDNDAVELVLRRRFRAYIDEVRYWLPQPWCESSQWLKRLPDLPAIQHLLSGRETPAWMSRDPQLRSFTPGDSTQRRRALLESDCAVLVAARGRGETLGDAWFRHWRGSWPTHDRPGLDQLAACLGRFVSTSGPAERGSLEQRRDALQTRLTGIFRRYSFQPAACYAHLALIALDLMRLRAALLRRILFAGGAAGVA